eukprot:TRINITY_DN21667_c0_g1_i1.p1 TRINITY_DN21667_c0_g1~~TRINITY_DN21667_c0_g1_i1.p1  ORF type:complete len:735 (+),score=109.39 TRINITY_DN21667_c0_g1_i1:59-2263(+)
MLARLQPAVRLSMLTYESKEIISSWMSGGSIEFHGCAPWYNYGMKSGEMRYVAGALHGETPDGVFQKCQWLAAEQGDTLYISFKGSDNPTDFVLDASISSVMTPSGSRVHAGFYSGVQPELPALIKLCNTTRCSHIVVCGHSLGGAYSIVAVLEAVCSPLWERDNRSIEAITFGAPLVVASSARDGFPALASRLGNDLPKITNVVGNYDIVPRLLALNRDTAISLVEDIPQLVVNSAVMTIAKRALPKAETVVDAFEGMRSTFAPIGTFLFSQTLFLNTPSGTPKRHCTGVLIQPDSPLGVNSRALAVLRYLPSVDPKYPCTTESLSSSNKSEFLLGMVKDHGIGKIYFPIADILSHNNVPMNAIPHSQTPPELVQTYEPLTTLGLAVPPPAVYKSLSQSDQESWLKLSIEYSRLVNNACVVRDEVMKREKPNSKVAQHTVGLRPSIEIELPEIDASSPKEKNVPTQAVMNYTKKDVCFTVGDVSKTISSGSVITTFGKCAESAMLNNNSEVSFPLPPYVKGEKRFLSIEDNPLLGPTVLESRAVTQQSASSASWSEWMRRSSKASTQKQPEGSIKEDIKIVFPAVSNRDYLLGSLSEAAEEALTEPGHVGVAIEVSPAPGVGYVEGKWFNSETCTCGAKFSKLMNPTHHCRECGLAVCGACSPSTRNLANYQKSTARICHTCETKLAGPGPVGIPRSAALQLQTNTSSLPPSVSRGDPSQVAAAPAQYVQPQW